MRAYIAYLRGSLVSPFLPQTSPVTTSSSCYAPEPEGEDEECNDKMQRKQTTDGCVLQEERFANIEYMHPTTNRRSRRAPRMLLSGARGVLIAIHMCAYPGWVLFGNKICTQITQVNHHICHTLSYFNTRSRLHHSLFPLLVVLLCFST